ncbi:hypothetical protein BDF21DRAFT_370745 [Thamnidium elegans]|nr:hypothetical protein BDF21DRAFT_370745 [Thamnidium elegans]
MPTVTYHGLLRILYALMKAKESYGTEPLNFKKILLNLREVGKRPTLFSKVNNPPKLSLWFFLVHEP